jgi:phosphate starvation-inducible protein PhoH
MARKTRTKKDRQLDFLTETMTNNGKAVTEGPKKKTFSIHDLKKVKPLTHTQRSLIESYMMGNHTVANGSAGTGKSYLSLFLALNDLLHPETQIKRVIIVRSAVATRAIGHLPGDEKEKAAVYEAPYQDIVGDLMNKRTAYEDMKLIGLIEFQLTSFVRSVTWDNAVIVIDEAQSMTFHELNSVITRLGQNSKLLICGDMAQNDLVVSKYDQTGFDKMLRVAARMDSMDIHTFTRDDIVRSPFVKSWICACEDVG